MAFWNVVTLAAVAEPNFRVPTILVPTVVPQVRAVPLPILTVSALAPAEKPPPLAVHWNVPAAGAQAASEGGRRIALQHAAVEAEETRRGNAACRWPPACAAADRRRAVVGVGAGQQQDAVAGFGNACRSRAVGDDAGNGGVIGAGVGIVVTLIVRLAALRLMPFWKVTTLAADCGTELQRADDIACRPWCPK